MGILRGETPTCAQNAPQSVPLFPKETPTPAYWGPHLVHVHVSMAPFVCPCFRVSAFGIWLKKKSHSRALRAFRAAVRCGRPGCFDHLKKLNHLQPETCPGASPQQAGGADFHPPGSGLMQLKGLCQGSSWDKREPGVIPCSSGFLGPPASLRPFRRQRNPSEGLRAPSCPPGLPTVPPISS